MIRLLARGVARLLFSFALLTLMAAAALVYLSFRVIRFAVAGEKPRPVQEAAFAAMIAGATLARAIKAAQESSE